MKLSKFILISLLLFSACSQLKEPQKQLDWQGHRGCRGLMPENSIPGFLRALEFEPITTLELDVVISKDSLVVVSHEPWLSEEICKISERGDSKEALNIFNLPYDQIRKVDCGSPIHPRFPHQKKMDVRKPLLSELMDSIVIFCQEKNRPLPMLNIEIKSRPEWDNIFTPTPEVFAQLLLNRIENSAFKSLSTIQSFDPRSLAFVHTINPSIPLAFLVEENENYNEALRQLGFTPDIYSPHYALVNPELIHHAKTLGMKVIPWTVNDQEVMRSLIELGVDGIITDYPNRIPERE